MSQLQLSDAEKADALGDCLSFRVEQVPPGELAALAGQLELRSVARNTPLLVPKQPSTERRLALVLAGRVAYEERRGSWSARRLLGAGELFGEEWVAFWTRPDLASRDATVRRAYALEDSLLLVCPEEAFSGAFPEVPQDPAERLQAGWSAGNVLQALLRKHRLRRWDMAAAESLLDLPAFEAIPCADLLALLEYATVEVLPAAIEPYGGLSASSVPDRLLVVCERELVRERAGPADSQATTRQPVERFGVGDVVGADALFRGEALSGRLRAPEGATLLVLPAEALREARRTIAGLVDLPAPPGNDPPRARWFLVIDALGDRLVPLDGLCEAASEFLAREHGDTVGVVHLIPEGLHPTHLRAPCLTLDQLAEHGFPSSTQEKHIVLVDASLLGSEAGANPILQAALARLELPVRAAVVFDDPGAWLATLRTLPPRLRRSPLPTAFLPSTPAPTAAPRGARAAGLGLRRLSRWGRSRLRAGLAPLQQALEQRLFGGGSWSDGAESRGQEVGPWPLGTLRLRLPARVLQRWLSRPSLTVLDELGDAEGDAAREGFGRWARALSGRLVGVSLGGGGALAYAGVAFIQELRRRGVPIDLVAGTSFGNVVGGFYAAEGLAGLDTLIWAWPSLNLALGPSWLTTLGVELWSRWHLGERTLDELPLAHIAVASKARELIEHDHFQGDLGRGLRLSSSLPPWAPTMHEGERLADGGLAGNAPSDILRACRVRLVAGVRGRVQPGTRSGPWPWSAHQAAGLEALDPGARWWDALRGQTQGGLSSGRAGARRPDVVYETDIVDVTPGELWRAHEIVERARSSPQLQAAVDEIELRWRGLLRPAANARPQAWGPLHLEEPSGSGAGGAPAEERLSWTSVRRVRLLAETLAQAKALALPDLGRRVVVHVLVAGHRSAEENRERARARGFLVKRQLVEFGIPEERIRVEPRSGDRRWSDAVELELR